MEKKNILIITPWLPWPLKSGGHQALFNGIYSIRDDYDISLVFEVHDRIEYKSAEKEFAELIPNVKLYPLMPIEKRNQGGLRFLRRILSFLKRFVFFLLKLDLKAEISIETSWIGSVLPKNKEFQDHIHSIYSNNIFDIIQVEMPWNVSVVLSLPKETKKIYVHHELGFVRRELEIKKLGKSAYLNSCKTFADMNEISLLNMYDRILTLSPVDKKKLVEAGVTVPVSASFATINLSKSFSFRFSDGLQLSFVGPDSHSPNYVGISWFLNNCWGELKKENPAYRLKIIGKWEEKHILEDSSKYPGVEFLGYVDKLGEAIQGTVMIVPITVGSGIRMKILEACSIGVPFVSTTVGAEGIPVENGKNCYVTDNPDEFVDNIIKLQNQSIQRKLIINARKMVEDYYSLDALRTNRLNIYDITLKTNN